MDVTTFYSYKGGLGRTLLLAWTAQSLAVQGKRVVAVDFDLEAPGLAFKLGFEPDADLGPGLVGLIRSFQKGEEAPETILPWLRQVPGYSNLWLLPAGPGPTPQYWADLASISWQDLFFNQDPQGTRFFAWLRDHLDADATPAHVLVDARTGVTELGGAALALLADRIVALVGTSIEGLTGTREVLRALLHAPRTNGRPAPRVGVVLSRLPATLPGIVAQDIRKTVRDFLNEEAEPLPATLELDLPLVVRSEPDLEVDERPALKGKNLRLHDDYRSFLEWFEGGPVPETMPGPGPTADGGVAALRASIQLHRMSANRDPSRYMPELARMLETLGAVLATEGKREEALEATREAVDIRRTLAQSNPDAFLPDLAMSLNNLGVRLSELGRWEEVLEATREAVEHYRTLAQRNPDAFLPHLARSLNMFGFGLSSLGRREEAFEVTREGLEHYRALAQRNPDAFLPDLAGCLNNFGGMLGELGRWEEALDATREAVDRYRALVQRNPGAFLPYLATSLNNLGESLSELGRQTEALAVVDEALDTLWPFFTRPPVTFADLAKELLDQSQVLHSSLGKPLPPTLVERLATFRRLTQS